MYVLSCQPECLFETMMQQRRALFGSPYAVVSKYGHNSAVCMWRIDRTRGEFSLACHAHFRHEVRVKPALFGSPCAVVSKYGHNSTVCMCELSVSRPLPARSGVKRGYSIKRPYGLWSSGPMALWPYEHAHKTTSFQLAR